MPSLDTFVSLIVHYRYILLFPIAVIDGPIITVIAGLLAAQGYLSFTLAYLIMIIGDVVGDIMYYALGRWGKTRVVERWGKFIGIQPRHLESMGTYLNAHPAKSILFGKLTHSAGFLVLVGSGMSRMPIKKFVWYNILGTIPKSFALMLLGYFLGSQYNKINSYIGKVSFVLFVLITLGFGTFYVIKRMRNAK